MQSGCLKVLRDLGAARVLRAQLFINRSSYLNRVSHAEPLGAQANGENDERGHDRELGSWIDP
jgi:hypothetical protein